jgi:CRP/FNR family transcriptional regulator, transcriptional activator FtrB
MCFARNRGELISINLRLPPSSSPASKMRGPWVRAHDFERCRSLPLFEAIAPEAFRRMTAGAHVQRFPAATMLLLEGDPVDFLYVLLDGQVELHGAWNDRETVLAVLQPVSTFILAAVVLEADALMSARTLERSEILMIPGDAVRRAVAENACFAAAVSRDLAGGYRSITRSYAAASSGSPTTW